MKCLEIVTNEVNLNLPVVEHDGQKWVPVRPICEVLGVHPQRQMARVEQDERFNRCQLALVAADGKERQMMFIPLIQLEAFLFTINIRASQKPEVRSRLLSFQQHVVTLIHQIFNGQHMNSDVVNMLMEQIKLLKEELAQHREIIAQQQNLVNYLVQKDNLNEQYVDKKLASAGASLLSSYGHKRRKLTRGI